ncbi:MAG TPA: DUF4268 domain-containing protein [Rhodanobacter sp.]
MFRIDAQSNRITKVEQVSFAELGYGERAHLQEWIANQPDALGEDLLIVQKEFDGFDDTRERLDLLAIDKTGSLVVIENKLDDSGRDVVWQAIKYASYCSTLSKTKIVDIYQKYLNRHGLDEGSAREKIAEFLGEEDFENIVLNAGTTQRIILVAAHFRKEVTSTVLWLMKHQVNVVCFKATPYRASGQTFLTLDQIIPLPDAQELMIGISEKEQEEQSTERGMLARHQLRLAFWRQTLDALENDGVTLYANVSPGKDNWLSSGSGLSGVIYSMVFNTDEVRAEFALNRAKEQNKAIFDYLFAQKDQIEQEFGEPLEWRRLDDKKASMIVSAHACAGHDRDQWLEATTWLVDHMKKIHRVFSPRIPQLKSLLR